MSMMMIMVRYSKHMKKSICTQVKQIISNNKSRRYIRSKEALWEQRGSLKERANEHLLKSRFKNAMIWDLINFLTNLHKVKDVLY